VVLAEARAGQSLAEAQLGAGGLGGEPQQEDLSGLAVPAFGRTQRQEANSGGGGPFDAGIFYHMLRERTTYAD
jgi:hypothetical protein